MLLNIEEFCRTRLRMFLKMVDEYRPQRKKELTVINDKQVWKNNQKDEQLGGELNLV